MSDKISDGDIRLASKVAEFMMSMFDVDRKRYQEATMGGIPHGDLAYGMALRNWIKNGKPRNAWFSYAPGEHPCSLLLAFRREISAEFGLPILTTEEGEARRRAEQAKGTRVLTHKVKDWGAN